MRTRDELPEVAELARRYRHQMIEILAAIARDTTAPAAARVMAATALLELSYERLPQTLHRPSVLSQISEFAHAD
jgi:hypothetical protein